MFQHTLLAVVGTLTLALSLPSWGQEARRLTSLDGTWEIAQGSMERVPERFEHRVPVPGLVDMAEPAFEEVGQKSQKRQAFWYRKTFEINQPIPAVARLKVHKAAYGSRVILNGQLLGEHLSSFTPGYFDAKGALKQGSNELVIRVGSYRDSVPQPIPAGWDYEKIRYTPGIFDSVELILSGTPHVLNVQTVPDIDRKTVGVHVWLRNNGPRATGQVKFTVRQAKGGAVAGEAQSESVELEANQETKLEVQIPIRDCRLWSPEDPFLYELEASTGSDVFTTRFGMRTFRFDQPTGRAMLNGKPYILRGGNVTLYRFFEDPSRGDRPWRQEWVRRLHQTYKQMHWNSLRYCIGFPPEFWYRIADEEGFIIQDEFPLWNMNPKPGEIAAEQLIREYTEWMQERWNHACVLIWDAQNETRSQETGKAIQAVRKLDYSNRPWDNGWAAAQDPGDCFESHPYLFQNPDFRLSGLERTSGVPRGNALPNNGNNAIIINEYCWLWVNRDGSPTTLTRKLYGNLLGDQATPQQRRHIHARYVAALTEFWRAHRKCAGVLHFCGLGYARPDGQTCDDFIDLEKLTWEPEFYRYVRDSFAPVGLMLNFFAEDLPAGKTQELPVIVINDLPEAWQGQVRLRLLRGEQVIQEKSLPCAVAALGEKNLSFSCAIPTGPGAYQFEAALVKPGSDPVRSLRDFSILTEAQRQERAGLCVGKPVTASSSLTKDGIRYPAANACDGRADTRWSSAFSDPQWLAVDLGAVQRISRVELIWEAAFARVYSIEVSLDGKQWKEVSLSKEGRGGTERIGFAPIEARWVRMSGKQRSTPYGYSLWEMRVLR